MLQISATDFKSNMGKYLTMVNSEEIQITKNGVAIAVLSAPKQKASAVDQILGVIPNDGTDVKTARKERLDAYDRNN